MPNNSYYTNQPNNTSRNEEWRELKKNGSGYPDPTAYQAIQNTEADYEKFRKLLGCIYRICELSGFRLEGHICVRDLSTGKLWD